MSEKMINNFKDFNGNCFTNYSFQKNLRNTCMLLVLTLSPSSWKSVERVLDLIPNELTK